MPSRDPRGSLWFRLMLGDLSAAGNSEGLRGAGISHILWIGEIDYNYYYPEEFSYLPLPLLPPTSSVLGQVRWRPVLSFWKSLFACMC